MRKSLIFLILTFFILFISTIFTLKIEVSFQKFVDSYFIISGLVTSIFLFKLLIEKGAFNTLGYSWQKTKSYVLFFLPKYRNYEPVVKSFDDYLEYKEKKKWKNLTILILASLFHLLVSIILSLIIFMN